MTLEERLRQIEERAAKDRATAQKEEVVLAALPEWARQREPRVHPYPLYGREASVTWQYDFFRYDPEGKKPAQPDLALMLRLAEELGPAEPLVMVRDGCLSFQAATYVAALPEEKQSRLASVVPVCPFLVKVETYQRQTAELSWWVNLGGVVCEVEVKLPFSPAWGTLHVEYSKHMGGKRVRYCEYNPSQRLHALFGKGGDPVADLQPRVKWASGSDDVPNSFTLYWCGTAGPADLARAMQAASPPSQGDRS